MNLKMQMRPRRAAGVADVGNDLPGFDLLACGDADARAVRVQCRQYGLPAARDCYLLPVNGPT